MKSGMIAAETIGISTNNKDSEVHDHYKNFSESWLNKELTRWRNFGY